MTVSLASTVLVVVLQAVNAQSVPAHEAAAADEAASATEESKVSPDQEENPEIDEVPSRGKRRRAAETARVASSTSETVEDRVRPVPVAALLGRPCAEDEPHDWTGSLRRHRSIDAACWTGGA